MDYLGHVVQLGTLDISMKGTARSADYNTPQT